MTEQAHVEYTGTLDSADDLAHLLHDAGYRVEVHSRRDPHSAAEYWQRHRSAQGLLADTRQQSDLQPRDFRAFIRPRGETAASAFHVPVGASVTALL
jgi:hypothetical protein